MNILIVSPQYYPFIGGVEYVVKSTAERLSKVGYNVTVLCGGKTMEETVINDVKVIRWPVFSPNNAYHIPLKIYKLKELLKKLIIDVDVVHIHNFHSVFPIWVGKNIWKLKKNIKLVATGHYLVTGQSTLRNLLWLFWKKYLKDFIKIVDIIHAVGRLEGERIVGSFPEAKNKLKVIVNGVEEDTVKYKWIGKNSDYIIYAGRLEKYKRVEKVIDLAETLGLKAIIVGKGAYRANLEEYSRKRYPNTKFMDYLPREKYLNLISKARYAINPSQREGFGIFIAEAMAIGVPAIVSKEVAETMDAPIVREVIDGLFLVKRIEIQTWNDVIKEYINKLYTN